MLLRFCRLLLVALCAVVPLACGVEQEGVPASATTPVEEAVSDLGDESLPGQFLTDPGGVEMVLIPAGTFLMGSPDNEEGRFVIEGPQHEVTLPAFYLGRYEVTNEEYSGFVSDHMYPPGEASLPVVEISWEEADDFAELLGGRLPTEEEWEYAARAGTTTRYWSGDAEQDLARVGWYIGNAGGAAHPVGGKPANAWGLHDVHGNVLEWTSSMHRLDYDVTEPAENTLGDRVVRGGCFVDDARGARSAYRYWNRPGDRWDGLGFRVLLPAPRADGP